MKQSPYFAAALALFAGAACSAAHAPAPAAPAAPTTAAITEADLRQRLFLIADDSMMGRESGSLGNYKTADYVASEFKRLGLEPAGENGSYFQTVPLWVAAVDARSRIEVGGVELRLGSDFLPTSLYAGARSLDGVQAIYGGPIDDTTKWISPEQAAGKLVVIDLPPGVPRRGLAIGPRWRQAAATAVVTLDAIGPETVASLREGRPVADTTRNPNLMPSLWLSRRAAVELLGADPSTLAPGTTGAPLHGWFDFSRTPVKYPARNVIAILRGSDPALRGEYVSLSAHNDHVGFDHHPVDHDSLRAFDRVIRPMGADSPERTPTAAEWTRIHALLDSLRKVHAPRLDSIRNGADDDGSGTVALLEIAESMALSGTRPRRSILFVNHMGEEAGLLGSKWFTDHPTVPIDSIVGEIDEDMVGRGLPDDYPLDGVKAASPTYMEVVGAKRLSREFGDSIEAANAREPLPFNFDYRYDAPGHPLQYYCRADHYNYARYGIPAVALSRGEHLDYHQVTDEAQYIDYPDLARVTRMVRSAALVLANMAHRPKLDVPKPSDPHVQCRQ
ncbi:MAG: M28 family peptidase [Gemmatimonadetes bacterium]|nr:M28 family peptidase [Gemmatimonadota bacterium]MBI3568714.1 M28 family peptidase [Gemmatimonadota bacterium]